MLGGTSTPASDVDDFEGMPDLVSSSSSGDHGRHHVEGDQSDEDSESDPGPDDLFTPLFAQGSDTMQDVLKALGQSKHFGSMFANLRPGFLTKQAGHAVKAKKAKHSQHAADSMAVPQSARNQRPTRSTNQKRRKDLAHKIDRVESKPPVSISCTQDTAIVPANQHLIESRTDQGEEQVAQLELQLNEALAQIQQLRTAASDADIARKKIEDLYERTIKEHKSQEAELGLLREINRAERKQQQKTQAKQNKLKRLQDRLIDDKSEPTPTSIEHDVASRVEVATTDIAELQYGTRIEGRFYGRWYPGSVSRIVEEKGSVFIEILWDEEATRSWLDTSSVRVLPALDQTWIACRDFCPQDQNLGCLAVRSGEALYKRCAGTDGWVFVQSAERLADIGWVPLSIFENSGSDNDLSTLSPPIFSDTFYVLEDEDMGIGQNPLEVCLRESLAKLLTNAKRAFIAETHVRDGEQRILDLEERCRFLEENMWNHMKKQSTDELQERVRRAEERTQVLEESLEFLQTEWGAGQTVIEQEKAKNAYLVEAVGKLKSELTAAHKVEKNLRLEFQPRLNQLNKRLTLLQQMHPALYDTVRWMEEGRFEELLHVRGQYNQVKVPVLALKWSHGAVNPEAQFGDKRSIYFAVDELIRQRRDPDLWFRSYDRRDFPDVVPYDGSLYAATANRRLTALMMVQSLNRSKVIQVTCNLRSYDEIRWKEKLNRSWNTTSGGLDVSFGDRRSAVSKHKGYPLFDAEQSAYDMMHQLFQNAHNRCILNAIDVRWTSKRESVLVRTIDGKTIEDVRRETCTL